MEGSGDFGPQGRILDPRLQSYSWRERMLSGTPARSIYQITLEAFNIHANRHGWSWPEFIFSLKRELREITITLSRQSGVRECSDPNGYVYREFTGFYGIGRQTVTNFQKFLLNLKELFFAEISELTTESTENWCQIKLAIQKVEGDPEDSEAATVQYLLSHIREKTSEKIKEQADEQQRHNVIVQNMYNQMAAVAYNQLGNLDQQEQQQDMRNQMAVVAYNQRGNLDQEEQQALRGHEFTQLDSQNIGNRNENEQQGAEYAPLASAEVEPPQVSTQSIGVSNEREQHEAVRAPRRVNCHFWDNQCRRGQGRKEPQESEQVQPSARKDEQTIDEAIREIQRAVQNAKATGSREGRNTKKQARREIDYDDL